MRRILKKAVITTAFAAALTAGMTSRVSAREFYKVSEKIDTKVVQNDEEGEKNYADGQAIIMYRASEPGAELASSDTEVVQTYTFEGVSMNDAGSAELASVENVYVSLVKSDIYTTEQLVNMYSNRSDIMKAEPNYYYHILDDDYSDYQWGLHNEGQNGGTVGIDIKADKINAVENTDTGEKVIAVVDTGMDYTHPDLASVVWNNPLPSSKLSGEHGYDMVNHDADPMDDNGHGTHCSGVMAGLSNDGSGISGVVASDNIKIMAIKVFDEDGYGSGIEAIGAYNYIYRAQQLGVNVVAVNNSWGGRAEETDIIFAELVDLVGKAGAVSVCSAGNESLNNDAEEVIPANIDSPYIISVAAANEKGELAGFSNYGAKNVDIAAPGTDILSSVSYDCFNPGIYSEAHRKITCNYYNGFEEESTVDYEVDVAGDAVSKIEITDRNYVGKTGGKSLKWTISDAEEDGVYSLIIPYDGTLSNFPVYASSMLRFEHDNQPGEGSVARGYGDSVAILYSGEYKSDGTPDLNSASLKMLGGVYSGNYWGHISEMIAPKVKKASKNMLVLQIMAAADGDYTLYIDDLAVSKSDVDSKTFGKYDFYNGTSMAAPYVTGAIAAISQAYPEEGALSRKAILFSCSRRLSTLSGFVATGGMLDFAMLDNPRMSVSDIYLDEDKNIQIDGKFLDGAVLTINGERIPVLSNTGEKMIVPVSQWMNMNMNLVIEKGEDRIERTFYFSDGKKLSDAGKILGELEGNEVLSDGNQLYNINSDGLVNVNSSGYEYDEWRSFSYKYGYEVFGDKYQTYLNYEIHPESNIVCTSDGLYRILTLDAEFTTESILVNFSIDGGWNKVSDIPDAFTEYGNMILGVYNGRLFLMGGLDEYKMDFGTDVYSYDLMTKKWTKEVSLPEGRAFSKAMQSGGKLVVTLGCCDTTGEYPANLIYDGSSWKKSSAVITRVAANGRYLAGKGKNTTPLMYYNCNIGGAKDDIVYIGNSADKLGNIYFYNVKSDKYESSGYSIDSNMIKDKGYCGTVHGDKCLLLVDAGNNIGETEQYSFSVDSACMKPTLICDEYSWFDNAAYAWLPSDIISYQPSILTDCYVSSFKVNGKAVKADENQNYSFVAPAYQYQNGFTIELKARPYITGISTVSSAVVEIGKSYKIVSKTEPAVPEADFQYESSAPKYITVSSKGVVRVLNNAKPGMKATITITANDGGGARTKVIIKVPSLPKKNSKVKVGNITYKITKSAKKGGTVSVVKLNNKKLTKVTIPDTVKIKGYTFKVTAVEKNAFKSCSKLKRITVKAVKLRKIGKGSFSTVHKKATIIVPKNQKNSYKKLLRKSGYKGTVKTSK